MKDTKHDLKEIHFKILSEMTEGYSGADLNVIVREASYEPMRKAQRAIRFRQENDKFYFCGS